MAFEINQTVYLKEISGNRPTCGYIEETIVVKVGDDTITTANGFEFETSLGTQIIQNPFTRKWRMYESKEKAETAVKQDKLSIFGKAFFNTSNLKHMTNDELDMMLSLIETVNKRAVKRT